jgi:hypothetical protein
LLFMLRRFRRLNLFKRTSELFAGGPLVGRSFGQSRLIGVHRLKKPSAYIFAVCRRANIVHRIGNARENRVPYSVVNPIKEVHNRISPAREKNSSGTLPRLNPRVKTGFWEGENRMRTKQ